MAKRMLRLARADMTSRQRAVSRQPEWRKAAARPCAEPIHDHPKHGNMAHEIVAAIAQEVQSEYGSDVSLTALSDYGSDIDLDDIDEDALLGDLLVKLAATAPKEVVYASVENGAQHEDTVIDPGRGPLVVRWEERAMQSAPLATRSASMEIEYDAPSRRAFSLPREEPPQSAATPEPPTDTRTPLERFRTKPKKPLSVTDLVSPAWCELQYFYNLSKFGRKPPTQAMKAGSKIHQALEDEVSIKVDVKTVSKEDRFGLRIWNTIQSLRFLRETGLTRELEVWGLVEGQVVNGVIDELSFTCPDPELEEKLEISKAERSGGTLPLGQLSIERAFQKAGGDAAQVESDTANPWLGSLEKGRQVYIADVKTRGARAPPSTAALRSPWMQLMLYRKLLESLSLNTVDAETIFARYSLAPLEPFSEAFILEGNALRSDDPDFDPENPCAILDANELQSHPNLLSMWSLMISEFQATIGTISDILRLEFRYARTGEVIGDKLMVYNAETIDAYIKEEMEWWKGGREAKGVEIEEAFKCRMCEFADECTWRKTKIDEATEKYRLRKVSREKSAV